MATSDCEHRLLNASSEMNQQLKSREPKRSLSLSDCAEFEPGDSIAQAKRIRLDQGNHEAEVSCGGEANLHTSVQLCVKNPGHERFIPAKDFYMGHLPVAYQDNDILTYVQTLANLTVRVCARYTSFERPVSYPDSSEPYPFFNFRGSRNLRTGSGLVAFVYKSNDPRNENEVKTCGCPQCQNSPVPRTEFGVLVVRTAAHVCFSSTEAIKTTCELFYNDSNKKDEVILLHGSHAEVNIENDSCEITCYTHDMELVHTLDNLWSQCEDLQQKIFKKYKKASKHRLAIVISHPHGCSKQVSVGQWLEKQETERYTTQYTYTACTCPGSSGAPVILLGRRVYWLNHLHSKACARKGLNMSGVGVW